MNWNIKIPWLLLWAQGLIMTSCGGEQNSAQTAAAQQTDEASAKAVTVEVVHPRARDFTSTVSVVGSAAPNQVVQLHAMESGFVTSIRKDIGDIVREGERIARLKNPELQRQYQKQKALMEAQKSIYTRLEGIADKTPALTTLDQVERAKADYQSVLAEYQATQDRLSFLSVNAPFDGIITQRFIDKGALVNSGLQKSNAPVLFEVMELATIRVQVPLPESDVHAVDVGTEARVVFPELPGKSYQAEVSRMAQALNPKSKTMELEIDLPNPDFVIKPGMYARVSMQVKSSDGVRSVPQPALVAQDDDFYLYTVENGIVKRMSIRRGLENKDYFEVLNATITDSTQVITRGKNLVKPGMKVNAIQKKAQHEGA